MMPRPTNAQLEDVAIKLLEAAAKLAPSVVDLLHDATKGRTDPFAQRVADILPERSPIDDALDRLKDR